MGRQKGALRRKLNGRYVRWRLSRAAVAAAPALKSRLNFYGAGVALEDAADALVFDDRTEVRTPLHDDQIDFIRRRCGPNDGPAEPAYWEAPWSFRDEHFALSETWILGHTGRLVDRAQRGIVTGWGEAENWNRDRIALLRRAAPVEGVALPVRAYTSYFHFFFDVALPLISYFESGAGAAHFGDAPHVIVTIGAPKPFVQLTLEAICARYGARLRRLGPSEKAICARAVSFRRASPCSDWFPVRPDTAVAARELLLAHLAAPAPTDLSGDLFLRRGREKLRNLTNADALDQLAAERGFQPFQPAADNFADQIQRLGAARRILAVHGAALTNLIFAPPGAHVVEIFSADFCKSVYLALCQMLGHTHVASIGSTGDYLQNFTADIGDVARALDRDVPGAAAAAAPSRDQPLQE